MNGTSSRNVQKASKRLATVHTKLHDDNPTTDTNNNSCSGTAAVNGVTRTLKT